jgi:DNA-binding winged helix-turn-helix (wHTH) protein
MQPPAHHAYEFGEFRFEPEEARLSRAGDIVNLEPKAIAVLGEMVTHPGHLLARDDLLDTVWGHRHVTPSTLNRIVTMLRQALGDEPTSPRYIETVPRMGYRFIAEVHAAGEDAHGHS